jgi:hypothetical protein
MEEKSDSYAPRTLTGMRLQDLLDAQDLKPLVGETPRWALTAAAATTQTSQTSPTPSDE